MAYPFYIFQHVAKSTNKASDWKEASNIATADYYVEKFKTGELVLSWIVIADDQLSAWGMIGTAYRAYRSGNANPYPTSVVMKNENATVPYTDDLFIYSDGRVWYMKKLGDGKFVDLGDPLIAESIFHSNVRNEDYEYRI